MRVKICLRINWGVAYVAPLLVLVFGLATPISAQTIAASCSAGDVQAAINSAPREGTVNIPSGVCTWSTTVTISKGLTLNGAGSGNTAATGNTRIIYGGGSACGVNCAIYVNPDATAITNGEIIRISNFTIDGNGGGYGLIGINGAADSGTKAFKNLIITGMTVGNTGTGSGNGNTCIYNLSGQTRGVIYNNIFDKCDIVLRPMGSDTTTEWSNTAYNNFSYGSSDNLYFESNTIEFSTSYNSSDGYGGWIESGQGGRVVVRFNTWDLSNLSNQSEFWDIHGFQNWNGSANSGQTGTMIAEYYHNTFTNGASSVYRWMNHRGSWLAMWSNSYSGASSPSIDINQYDQGSGGSGCANEINPTPTNYTPQVNNTYVWNNFINGTETPMTPGPVGNGCGTAENKSYWNDSTSSSVDSNAAFAGTVGVGEGTLSSRPSTCTIGVGYWATDQGNWNNSGSGGQGVLYKCTSTNNWTLFYTPYTYPHPLRTGITVTVNAPTNLAATVH